MSWKELPSWLKYGLFFAGVGLILSWFRNLGLFYIIPTTWIQEIISSVSLSSLILGELRNRYTQEILYSIINIGFYFLVGALIGWIVGKFKNKNEKREK